MTRRSAYAFLLFLCLLGCLDPYEPSHSKTNPNLLVVDGFINATHQTAAVTLSRTLQLDTNSKPEYIDQAQVIIENEDGSRFPLQSASDGKFTASSLPLNMSSQYRLAITLATGEKYLSDYISLNTTPPIDSVTFGEAKDGITIFANTHDPTGDARYYKWEYDETWEYTTLFVSNYKFVNGQVSDRTIDERINVCWGNASSTRILVANTLRLSEDIVSAFPVASVAAGSVQLSKRYSINVKQRTLSEDEYHFWEQLSKTTESVGGLFDPIPYPVKGNLHGVDNDDVVLGYFGGGEVTEKRIFIRLADLPPNVVAQSMRPSCYETDLKQVSLSNLGQLANTSVVLIDAIYEPFVGIVGYTYTFQRCGDCRTQGGTTKQPDFW